MKKRIMSCLAAILCIMPVLSCAGADSITLNGKTIPAETIQIYAPVSGTAESVPVEAGQKVQADDTIFTMKTTKVYADHDGKVSGIFGQPGDDTESVTARYGAVLYIEESPAFTVSASTSGAYNSMETKYVHPGEYVYVASRNSVNRTGEGVITTISGTNYTVEISEGTFLTGETVEVFRDPEYDYQTRIGKGTVTYSDPVAVTGGTGSIVNIAVEDGQEVKRGDLLMETVDGTFDAYVMSGTTITAGVSGVVGSVNVQAGGSVTKDAVAAELYSLETMRAEASIPEDYISQIHEGDPVTVELSTDMNKTYSGKIVMISAIAAESEEEVTYRVVAEFTPDEEVRFGMSVLMTAGEEEKTVKEEPEAETEKTEDEAAEEKNGKRERPEGGRGGKPEEAPGEIPETQAESNP